MVEELDKLKWIGADEGWELAIEAVQKHLMKKIIKENKCKNF